MYATQFLSNCVAAKSRSVSPALAATDGKAAPNRRLSYFGLRLAYYSEWYGAGREERGEEPG